MGVDECTGERMVVSERVHEVVDRAEIKMTPTFTYSLAPTHTFIFTYTVTLHLV
jgi:hypothetical protein